mmetsp:Transcript_64983/g.188413  ORF Transcript_64983/g.188413 Transcript_64983/m.188413 type:complete len:224 (+) Transcript_64983:992-1663(+)
MLRDGHVLLPRARLTDALLELLHGVVALRQLVGLLVVFGQQEELDGVGDLPALPAVVRDELRPGGEFFLADDLHSLLGVVELLEADLNDAVQVVGALVGLHGFPESAAGRLRLGVVEVQLRRVDLVHQRGHGVEVEALEVQRDGLVVRAGRLEELRRLGVLAHPLQDLRALLGDLLVLQALRQLNAPLQVAGADRRPRDARLATLQVVLAGGGHILHRLLVVV